MGQEIKRSRFTPRDFAAYHARLEQETALLLDWFRAGRFSERRAIGGFEVEAWLIDQSGRPAAINDVFLAQMNDDMVVAELAKFNVELNVAPQALRDSGLARMQEELDQRLERCRVTAAQWDCALLMIGILPTLREGDLTLVNMSDSKRYRALNEQVLKARQGSPLRLDIAGREHLHIEHHDVMLESATTSFQVHLQVPGSAAARYYNAAVICSAPMVAVTANSPYLFGQDLWDETRIPLFEQAVEVGGFNGAAHGPVRRVTFGSGYVRDSVGECFVENLAHYPALLPVCFDQPPERMAHLRLHNGTIWRWNRPLIGLDEDGVPHLRIEHRVIPAGPSAIDQLANAAFFFGLVEMLAGDERAPELCLAYTQARDNFYDAARYGLEAQITWLDGRRHMLTTLLDKQLLPLAREGLARLEMSSGDAQRYLDVIGARVRGGRTGAAWQRDYIASHGHDMRGLTAAYRAHQRHGDPVHDWPV